MPLATGACSHALYKHGIILDHRAHFCVHISIFLTLFPTRSRNLAAVLGRSAVLAMLAMLPRLDLMRRGPKDGI